MILDVAHSLLLADDDIAWVRQPIWLLQCATHRQTETSQL